MHAQLSIDETRRTRRISTPRLPSRALASRVLNQGVWAAFNFAVVVTLYFGWINRNERHWTAEHGLGYWLGIAGVAAMVLLLIYPLRKRWRALRFLGAVPFWFRLHMGLGLIAPTLILLHCNFKSSSANASVALYSMLVVALSGLVGRYLYRHVYSQLTGRRIEASEYFEEARDQMSAAADSAGVPRMSAENFDHLSKLTVRAIAPQRSLSAAISHRHAIGRQSRGLARKLARDLDVSRAERGLSRSMRRQHRREMRLFTEQIGAHCRAIRRAASLSVHERLFALWHVLHMPLFLMLIVAVVVHIVAVHLY